MVGRQPATVRTSRRPLPGVGRRNRRDLPLRSAHGLPGATVAVADHVLADGAPAVATLAVGRAWGHREVAVSGDGGEARVAVARVAAGFAGPLVRVLVVWWGLLTVVVVGVGSLVALPAAADAATTTTIVNFDAAGHQVTRYDTVGDAVDAHDGDLGLFGDLYYLYGTRYDCGYTLGVTGTRFCGF